MNIKEIFEVKGLEAARNAARRAGDGRVVAEFIRLQREAEEREVNHLPNFLTRRPAPRVGKTARDRARRRGKKR